MKTIIVLTFFGILGFTFCHVHTGPEGCRDVYNEADPNLRLNDFFTGSWYLTYAKHQNHTTDCVEFVGSTNPFQIKYEVFGKKVTCEGKQAPNARHVDFDCKGDGGETTPYTDYQSVMAVIATDYNTYGTLYTCKKSSGHEENVFVLTRSKSGSPPEGAKTAVTKLGDTFDKYTKFNC